MTMNAKAAEHQQSEPCGLDITISARYDWSIARQLTSLPLHHWNLRNLTLQTCFSITPDFFHLHSTFTQLYNAAASLASRLCSAGSLAIVFFFIINLFLCCINANLKHRTTGSNASVFELHGFICLTILLDMLHTRDMIYLGHKIRPTCVSMFFTLF